MRAAYPQGRGGRGEEGRQLKSTAPKAPYRDSSMFHCEKGERGRHSLDGAMDDACTSVFFINYLTTLTSTGISKLIHAVFYAF